MLHIASHGRPPSLNKYCISASVLLDFKRMRVEARERQTFHNEQVCNTNTALEANNATQKLKE